MNIIPGSAARLVDLPALECWQLLESAEIARVAWDGPRGVAVVPVNYAVADGALWFRTTSYSHLVRECNGRWVEVEVEGPDPQVWSGWSTVVRGVAEIVDAAEAPEHLADVQVWPSGLRNLFVRVDPVEVTGRRLFP
jgi:nitroimidazol reductase NimA-like FMN-containing flavoprotein (pyridoxamine 5'-phosphate oxidase superfamily)